MMWRGIIKDFPIDLSPSNKFNKDLSVSITKLFKIICNTSQIITLEKKY